MSGVVAKKPRPAPPALAERGYRVVYHEDETNRCPGCGRTSWYIGRSTAECSFCGTALPLADSAR